MFDIKTMAFPLIFPSKGARTGSVEDQKGRGWGQARLRRKDQKGFRINDLDHEVGVLDQVRASVFLFINCYKLVFF